MMQRQTKFPLVSDDEQVVGDNPQMNLYEEADLISNIRGQYQEKDFEAQPSLEEERQRPLQTPLVFEREENSYSRKERFQVTSRPKVLEKTQGQVAREQARDDLKKKRSASYLRDDKPLPTKRLRPTAQPALSSNKEKGSHLSHLADKLQQTSYIVADLPAVYSLEKEARGQESGQAKNSYDFLRKSQVYDYPERQVSRERQVAQELNLTHMEEGVK